VPCKKYCKKGYFFHLFGFSSTVTDLEHVDLKFTLKINVGIMTEKYILHMVPSVTKMFIYFVLYCRYFGGVLPKKMLGK
jgi:hypothetical protein